MRPALRALVDYLGKHRHVGAVIVANVDRLGRNVLLLSVIHDCLQGFDVQLLSSASVVDSTVAWKQPSSYNSCMTAPRNLARTLTRLRRESGQSVRELEATSGVDRSTISRIESGANANPGPSTLNRLALGLGVDASELLTAAGHTATKGEALPALRPYLRSKYGHLSADARRQLEDLLGELEAEQTTKRATRTTKKPKSRTSERRS